MTNTPLKNGIIMGVVLSVASLGMILMSPEAYVTYGRFILFIVALFFMRKIGRDEKELNEGIINFGDAFKAIFIGSFIAYIFLNVSEFISYNFIKPELDIFTQEAAVKSAHLAVEILEKVGVNQPILDLMIAEIPNETSIEKTRRSPINAGTILFLNALTPCILWGIIISLFVRSKNS